MIVTMLYKYYNINNILIVPYEMSCFIYLFILILCACLIFMDSIIIFFFNTNLFSFKLFNKNSSIIKWRH